MLGGSPCCAHEVCCASCGGTSLPCLRSEATPLPDPEACSRNETAVKLEIRERGWNARLMKVETVWHIGLCNVYPTRVLRGTCPSVFNAHHSSARYSPHASGLVAERSCRKKSEEQEHITKLLPPSMVHNVCHLCPAELTMSLLSRDSRLCIRHSHGLLSFPRRRESIS